MIKKITLLFTFILLLSYSCKNKEQTTSIKKNDTTLSGKYRIASVKMDPRYNIEKLDSLGMLNFGETPFEFSNNKLKISPELGKHFSGITEFTYQLTNDKLILFSSRKKFELDYKDDGIFRLEIKDKFFKRLDLVKIKKLK